MDILNFQEYRIRPFYHLQSLDQEVVLDNQLDGKSAVTRVRTAVGLWHLVYCTMAQRLTVLLHMHFTEKPITRLTRHTVIYLFYLVTQTGILYLEQLTLSRILYQAVVVVVTFIQAAEVYKIY